MSTYASFQGRVFLGKRDESGLPIEVRSPGNVAEFKLSLKTDVLEHYEKPAKPLSQHSPILTHRRSTLYSAHCPHWAQPMRNEQKPAKSFSQHSRKPNHGTPTT